MSLCSAGRGNAGAVTPSGERCAGTETAPHRLRHVHIWRAHGRDRCGRGRGVIWALNWRLEKKANNSRDEQTPVAAPERHGTQIAIGIQTEARLPAPVCVREQRGEVGAEKEQKARAEPSAS